jgi:hypothetical protein
MDHVLPKSHVAAASDAGRTVLVDMVEGRYYALNSTAAHIWFLLVDGFSTIEIATRLATQYSISQSEATAHVDAFVTHLCERALAET